MLMYILTAALILSGVSAQQISGNSISDFVGQLASLINQNGGLGSLVNVIQQAGNRYPSPASNGYPLDPGINPAYLPNPYEQPDRPRPPSPGVPPPYPSDPYYPPPSPGIGGFLGPTGPGFMSALASIARHDELKCVPRLLCELTSGGKPGYSGNQPSVLPLTNKDSLITLLTVLNFIDESPLLVFGRAALLGYTARGNSKACINAYPTCPRDPDQLVNYLNNYNGGFFRYFSGSPSPHHHPGHHYRYAGQYPSDYHHTQNNAEERIQNRPYPVFAQAYPVDGVQHTVDSYGRPIVPHSEKIVFPERTGKQLQFPSSNHLHTSSFSSNFFPDRTGTGNLVLDSNANKVYYASSPNSIVSFRDQRSVKFPPNNPVMHFPKYDY